MKLRNKTSGEVFEAKVLAPTDGDQDFTSGRELYGIETDLGREYFIPGDYLVTIGEERRVYPKKAVEDHWEEVPCGQAEEKGC